MNKFIQIASDQHIDPDTGYIVDTKTYLQDATDGYRLFEKVTGGPDSERQAHYVLTQWGKIVEMFSSNTYWPEQTLNSVQLYIEKCRLS